MRSSLLAPTGAPTLSSALELALSAPDGWLRAWWRRVALERTPASDAHSRNARMQRRRYL
jgi:hypothetical protein